MPPKLPPTSGEKTIRTLKYLGFVVVRQRGSHVSKQEEITCVVPLHDELATGTLRGILKQAGVTVEEFINHL
jgi:predicted RNA binding protein YcfA (HicA-like mRNA interferase family)